MATFKLRSTDGEIVEMSMEVIACFRTVKTMLDNLGAQSTSAAAAQQVKQPQQEEQVEQSIPIPNVTGDILRKLVEWCEYHKADDTTKEFNALDIPDWDAAFLDVEQKTLYQIILASNYLDIRLLFDIACKTVVKQMQSKTPEEIREVFNIKNDLTFEHVNQTDGDQTQSAGEEPQAVAVDNIQADVDKTLVDGFKTINLNDKTLTDSDKNLADGGQNQADADKLI